MFTLSLIVCVFVEYGLVCQAFEMVAAISTAERCRIAGQVSASELEASMEEDGVMGSVYWKCAPYSAEATRSVS